LSEHSIEFLRQVRSWHGRCNTSGQDQKLARLKAKEEIETSFYRAGATADQAAQTEEDTEASMNAKQTTKSGIEQQLSAINMSERMRRAALQEARIAEAFVELFTWGGTKVSRPSAGVFANPSPKY
jgi:uncharacterized protein YaiL (DUF2058 family)